MVVVVVVVVEKWPIFIIITKQFYQPTLLSKSNIRQNKSSLAALEVHLASKRASIYLFGGNCLLVTRKCNT